jgi:hypothetical protein
MIVQPESRMTDEQFLQHLNRRHIPYKEDWGGLTAIREDGFHEDRSALAVYHRRLHRKWEYEHEHTSH